MSAVSDAEAHMAAELSRQKMALAATRIGIGAVSFLAPGLTGKLIGADLGDGGRLMVRLFGSRDAILGVGQLLGERHGTARGWYEAAMVVDGLDVAAMLVATARGEVKRPLGIFWAAVAFAGLAGGFVAARSADGDDDLEAELAELTAAGI